MAIPDRIPAEDDKAKIAVVLNLPPDERALWQFFEARADVLKSSLWTTATWLRGRWEVVLRFGPAVAPGGGTAAALARLRAAVAALSLPQPAGYETGTNRGLCGWWPPGYRG